jgi:hypothetical protein
MKRAVTTDALETLGTIISESEKRDAIHLAVEPVIAAQRLRPGEDVGFVDGGVGICDKPVGIVDPFLKENVSKGERFWLVVYPRQITSLRHVWTHPAFSGTEIESNPIKTASELWIRNYAADILVDYNELLQHASFWIESEDYWSEGSRFEGEYIPDEFWDHYQAVTGIIVPLEKQGNFFSCSC